MFEKVMSLPLDSFIRGRLIGKDGKKIKDIKEVSSAEVHISGNEVYTTTIESPIIVHFNESVINDSSNSLN